MIIVIILLASCNHKQPVDSIVIYDTITTIVIRDTVIVRDSVMVRDSVIPVDASNTLKKELLVKLESQLRVREITPNRSPEIDMYNKSVNVPVGSKWCAAFVSYNLSYFNIPNPNSAWSPSFSKTEDIIWKPKLKNSIEPDTGDVVSYYNPRIKRVYHVGILGYVDKNGYPIVYEGNTSGGRGLDNDGDGVFKKKRDFNKIYSISRYIK